MARQLCEERLAFIEMLALWQGYVRNCDVVKQFYISRQQAYKDINQYQQLHPQCLLKNNDASYYFSKGSSPQYFDGHLDTYLHWLQTHEFVPTSNSQSLQAYSLTSPPRKISPQIIAILSQAIRKQLKVEIAYVSLSNPEADGRLFSPHCFVKAGGRWHVRGFCEKSNGYRDLVLSRFRGEALIEGNSIHSAQQDDAWQTLITLILAPDQRLSLAQQEVLMNDYQMNNGQLHLTTRAALADYLLKEMQVNTKYLDDSPEAQQLVLVNRNDIKQWLFSS